MLKKIFRLFVIVPIFFLLFNCFNNHVYSVSETDLIFVSDYGSAKLLKVCNTYNVEFDLVIPESVDGNIVTEIHPDAFKGVEKLIKSIQIPKTLKNNWQNRMAIYNLISSNNLLSQSTFFNLSEFFPFYPV